MINALRIVRTQPQSSVLFSPKNLGPRTSGLKSRQFSIVSCKQASQQNMDKADAKDQHKNEKFGDSLSHSFGEGYATRCDEEGFGGIYGRNTDPEDDPAKRQIHESHPDYDKEQGSEVKEKEKARNQTSPRS